jgi:hypothetical protein
MEIQKNALWWSRPCNKRAIFETMALHALPSVVLFLHTKAWHHAKKNTSPPAPAAVGMLVFVCIQLVRKHSVRISKTCPGDHSASQTMKRIRQSAESVKICEHLNQTAEKQQNRQHNVRQSTQQDHRKQQISGCAT